MFEVKKHIAGTEGTHNYAIIAETANGLVAVRILSEGSYRVRVQPADHSAGLRMAQTLTRLSGWKQPGDQGQDRFSTVPQGGAELHKDVSQAIAALTAGGAEVGQDWQGALAAVVMVGSTDRDTLIDKVRAAKTPGAGFAKNWTTTALVAKLVAEAPHEERVALVIRLKQAKLPGANLAVNWSLETLRKKAVCAA